MTDVSRETSGLDRYEKELLKWDRHVRLVGRELRDGLTDDILHDAHLLADHLGGADVHVDAGTGNGLPAIPALLVTESTPQRSFLIEADRRKAAFLRSIRRQLGLEYEVLSDRVEDIPYLAADLISAKAFAPLPRLLDLCVPHLARNGRILAFKGRHAEVEIADARRTWDFEVEREGRNARTGAVLLVITEPGRKRSA